MTLHTGRVGGKEVYVSDHHPSCECGGENHYDGCQLKSQDAESREEWLAIVDDHNDVAEKLELRAEKLRNMAKLAKRLATKAAP